MYSDIVDKYRKGVNRLINEYSNYSTKEIEDTLAEASKKN